MITSIKYSPGGRFLASGGEFSLCVWSVDQDGKIDAASLQTLSEHTSTIFSAAWSKDGNRLATASGDGLVHIWPVDANNGVVVPATGPQVLAGHTSAVMAADWHPEGGRLATVSRDSTVRIWSVSEDWDGGLLPPQVLDGRFARMTSVAWSPDGNHLLIPSVDGNADVVAILGLLDIDSMKQAVVQRHRYLGLDHKPSRIC